VKGKSRVEELENFSVGGVTINHRDIQKKRNKSSSRINNKKRKNREEE